MSEAKFCPEVNNECKLEQCMYWVNELSDCAKAVDAKDRVKWIVEEREGEKIGLHQVNKDLQRLVTKTFINDLARDPNLSESDRVLLIKLHGEATRLGKMKDMKGMNA